MCSTPVSHPVTIKVEGALLRVCPKCSSFGNIVQESRGTPGRARTPLKQSRTTGSISTTPRQYSKTVKEEKILLKKYGEEVKNARMKKKWTQEALSSKSGVSIPLIRSIEAQKIRPTDAVLHKLERELEIELFYTPETEIEFQEKSKKKETTLGDIAVIKRLEWD